MRSWVGYRAIGAAGYLPPITPAVPLTGVLEDTGLSEMFAPPKVTIRRYAASRICDVVVRGQEMVVGCPTYAQAVKWARLECKSYKIPQPDIELLISEPEIEPLGGLDHDEELPLFLRCPGTT